jgi:hypothetical protein
MGHRHETSPQTIFAPRRHRSSDGAMAYEKSDGNPAAPNIPQNRDRITLLEEKRRRSAVANRPTAPETIKKKRRLA